MATIIKRGSRSAPKFFLKYDAGVAGDGSRVQRMRRLAVVTLQLRVELCDHLARLAGFREGDIGQTHPLRAANRPHTQLADEVVSKGAVRDRPRLEGAPKTVDASKPSPCLGPTTEAALRAAAREASCHGADLTVLHALPMDPGAPMSPAAVEASLLQRQELASAVIDAVLDAGELLVGRTPEDVPILVEDAPADRAILDAAHGSSSWTLRLWRTHQKLADGAP